jgi:hypothetical protein
MRQVAALVTWPMNGFPAPAPQRVKMAVLARYGLMTGTWVETGTFLGHTTAFLAKRAQQVFTIEPAPALAERARRRFARHANIDVIEALSEDVFPSLLSTLTGDVSFWLDGHSSGGFTHSGPQVTPIREELACIEANVHRYRQVCIAIDDVRGFPTGVDQDTAYPRKSEVIAFADRLNLRWSIEHDIFVAWRTTARDLSA